MAKLFIQDTTLTAIADAIRQKSGATVEYFDYMTITVASKTYDATEYDYTPYTFPGAASIKVTYTGTITYPSSGAGKFGVLEGNVTTGGFNNSTKIVSGTQYSFNGDTFTLYGKGAVTVGGTVKVYGYDADGNQLQYAVESEGGVNTTQYKPTEMPAAILAISGEGGGGITPSGELEIIENGSYDVTTYASAQVTVPTGIFPEGTFPITENGEYNIESYASVLVDVASSGGSELEPIVLTGSCDYACAGALANGVIPQMPGKITTNNIYQATYMFYNSGLQEIPFELNFYPNYDMAEVNHMFFNAAIKKFPTIKNLNPKNASQMFSGCSYLADIPEGATSTWSFNKWQTSAAAQVQHMFKDCRRLRHIDSNLLKNLWNCNPTYLYNVYYYLFYGCTSLDEVRNLGVSTATLTGNAFNSTFLECGHMKNFTFVSGKSANWKSQTIDLTSIGYLPKYVTRSDDFTTDLKVTDLTSYEALNGNSAWWTEEVTFSRYNHDSAVSTINSLPTITSTGGTNTIKFKGTMGSGYSKAISDLTDAEIAVATAKGWTVSIT